MRLLFLSSLYPPYDLGGFEQWCHEVTQELQRRGHVVQVLTSRYSMPDRPEPADAVLRTLYLQADVHHYRPADFFIRRRRQEEANALAFKQVVQQFAPDLTVIWGMWNLSRNLPYLAEQWLPGRLAYYIASYWPMDADIHEEYWRLSADRSWSQGLKRALSAVALTELEREGYPPKLRFDQTMSCSRYVRDTLVDAKIIPANAGVLYGGIDPSPFVHTEIQPTLGPRAKPLQLLYFGSLLPHKGVHTAIEALGLLKQRGLIGSVELTLLGGGHPDYEAQLRALVTQLDIRSSVHFAGRVKRDEIPTWLQRFDVFLFTSTWPEPFGRTIVEAMAAGLVVIGADVGGSKEIFENYSEEMLFQPGDSSALADRIAEMVADPTRQHRLAQAGRQLVLARFTMERMVTDMENWFSNLIG